MQGPRELRAVRMNGPDRLFKQAVGSDHRAVFDIKSNSKGCARFVIGSNARSSRIANRRQSPGKALGAALNALKCLPSNSAFRH
jgi:hypothetical protein